MSGEVSLGQTLWSSCHLRIPLAFSWGRGAVPSVLWRVLDTQSSARHAGRHRAALRQRVKKAFTHSFIIHGLTHHLALCPSIHRHTFIHLSLPLSVHARTHTRAHTHPRSYLSSSGADPVRGGEGPPRKEPVPSASQHLCGSRGSVKGRAGAWLVFMGPTHREPSCTWDQRAHPGEDAPTAAAREKDPHHAVCLQKQRTTREGQGKARGRGLPPQPESSTQWWGRGWLRPRPAAGSGDPALSKNVLLVPKAARALPSEAPKYKLISFHLQPLLMCLAVLICYVVSIILRRGKFKF